MVFVNILQKYDCPSCHCPLRETVRCRCSEGGLGRRHRNQSWGNYGRLSYGCDGHLREISRLEKPIFPETFPAYARQSFLNDCLLSEGKRLVSGKGSAAWSLHGWGRDSVRTCCRELYKCASLFFSRKSFSNSPGTHHSFTFLSFLLKQYFI